MNKKLVAVLSCLAMLMPALPAVAHHSTAHYNFRAPLQVNGTVKLLTVTNPHLKLILIVSDSKGMREIEYEGHSLNHYYRAGWRKGLIVVGDKITVNYSPLLTGEDGGYVIALQTAKGAWITVGAPIQ